MPALPETPVPNERLWIRMPGEVATAIRVVQVDPPCFVTIDGRRVKAVPVRKLREIGAGTFMVPLNELAEAAPLRPAEVAEYDRLDGQLAGSIGDRRALREFYCLLHRAAIYGEAADARVPA